MKAKKVKNTKTSEKWAVGVVEVDGVFYKADIRYDYREGQVVVREFNVHPEQLIDMNIKEELPN